MRVFASRLPALLAAVLFVSASFAPRARADVPPGTGGDADELFRQGVAALRANDPESAAGYFEQSNAIYRRLTTTCNLALAYDRWPGHAQQAAETYEDCARMDDTGSYRQHARERAAAIRAELAQSQTPVIDPTHTPIIESPVWGEGATTWGSMPGQPPVGGPGGGQVDTTPGPSATWLVLGLCGIAAGGVALGVGIGLELDAQSRADALLAQYGGYDLPESEQEELDSIRSQRDLGIGLYVGAAVLGAIGLGSLFAFISEAVSGPSGPVVTGSLGPDGGRLVLRSRF